MVKEGGMPKAWRKSALWLTLRNRALNIPFVCSSFVAQFRIQTDGVVSTIITE